MIGWGSAVWLLLDFNELAPQDRLQFTTGGTHHSSLEAGSEPSPSTSTEQRQQETAQSQYQIHLSRGKRTPFRELGHGRSKCQREHGVDSDWMEGPDFHSLSLHIGVPGGGLQPINVSLWA